MSTINHHAGNTCQYLFGKNAKEIFSNLKIADSTALNVFVNRCLDLMIRINVFLLSTKDSFFLIDPMALNNQCHLYALNATRIKRAYSGRTQEDNLARTQENRFLHLAFFLNYALLSNAGLFARITNACLSEMKEKTLTPARHFQAFLYDEGRCRENASRLALNHLFAEQMKALPSPNDVQARGLYRELQMLAFENLQMESSRGIKQGVFYTYPHLAGVVYMIDAIARENIPFVIKVKVLTKEGAAGVLMQAIGKADRGAPVIIFEGIATDGTYSLPKCREEAKHCPSYFYRYVEKNKRHKEDADCFFCRRVVTDLAPFRERFQVATSSPKTVFYALGTDFVIQRQEVFKSFFENREKYPLLSKIFFEALPDIERLGVGMANPTAFSICHTHIDLAEYAFSEQMMLDSSPEKFLQERRILD